MSIKRFQNVMAEEDENGEYVLYADYSKVTTLVKEFISLLDKKEETDGGREFRPNYIDSCRCLDGVRLNKILKELKRIVCHKNVEVPVTH